MVTKLNCVIKQLTRSKKVGHDLPIPLLHEEHCEYSAIVAGKNIEESIIRSVNFLHHRLEVKKDCINLLRFLLGAIRGLKHVNFMKSNFVNALACVASVVKLVT